MFSVALRPLRLGFVFLAWLVSSSAGVTAEKSESRSALEQRQAEFAAAMSSREASRVAAFFTEGGVLHIANQPPIENRAAIERFYAQVFRFLAATEMVPGELRFGSGEDLAYATARVSNSFERDGQRTDYVG